MANYRVHYRAVLSKRDHIVETYCLEAAVIMAVANNGQISDNRGVIIPRDEPGYCLQCELTHLP